MYKATLVLEGGAARAVFTAGALDYLMEKDVYFSHVIGVSAGACTAMDYVSRQPYRTKKCMIPDNKEWEYINTFRKFMREGSVMDMDLLFDRLPNELLPFDYDTFFKSDTVCEIVATNCLTGRAVYFQEKSDKERLSKICRASSSIPLLSPIVNVDGAPYLDGGIADFLPLKRALTAENDKIVFILTRNEGYRKKAVKKGFVELCKRVYSSYPAALKRILTRSIRYNRIMDEIDALEDEGKVFVLRPLIKSISRFERDRDALLGFYGHGYSSMAEKYEELVAYLQG